MTVTKDGWYLEMLPIKGLASTGFDWDSLSYWPTPVYTEASKKLIENVVDPRIRDYCLLHTIKEFKIQYPWKMTNVMEALPCWCGSDSCNSPMHSDYCPKFKDFKDL
jgi:hypothetical protein